MEKFREDLKERAAEMEPNALKAVIDLVEVSQLVNLPELLEHLVVEECVALFNSNGRRHRKASSSRSSPSSLYILKKLAYTALIDLKDGNSISRKSADTRWYPIQVVGLYQQGFIHHLRPSW